jgi:hypothetical protein
LIRHGCRGFGVVASDGSSLRFMMPARCAPIGPGDADRLAELAGALDRIITSTA